jgi:hypothetical protein
MADTRGANPEYALDVDEMILEYLLYNTTKAHLQDSRSNERPEDVSDPRDTDTAETLLQVFDQFLELFKINYPEYDFSPDTDFGIKLLQFVVLYTNRKSHTALSPSSREQLKQLCKQNSATRMEWWERRSSKGLSSPEDSIIDCWHDFVKIPASIANDARPAFQDNLRIESGNYIPLLELLPRFLDISADIAANLGQDVTEQWMLLAAEFMLQSAWEKFVYLDADANEEPLKVAFGWGRWHQEQEFESSVMEPEARKEAKAAEGRVNTMFSTSNEFSEESSGREMPEWTKIRLEHLSAFGTPPGGNEDSKQAQRWQVERLRKIAEQYPIQKFDGKVVDFLEGLWKLGQKPLLVQIEEGKIEGLTKDEFEQFMENVFPTGSGTQEIGQGGKWWN